VARLIYAHGADIEECHHGKTLLQEAACEQWPWAGTRTLLELGASLAS